MDFQDPEFVQVYLEEALNEGVPSFLMALHDVLEVNPRLSETQEYEFSDGTLGEILSEADSLPFTTVERVLKALGLRFQVSLSQ
jgi:DNA-binding phage protein